MKFKFFCLFCAFLALILGMKIGGGAKSESLSESLLISQSEFPVSEHKSFAIILYAYNQAEWCERSLLSIMSQDYDHFRVFFIDDASSDETARRAKAFILENNQQHRVVFVQNESHLGESVSLYQAAGQLLDKEIVLPLKAKDWLAHPNALNSLNRVYQNPDVWMACSSAILYPTYEIKSASQLDSAVSFYAALFKQISLADLMKEEGAQAYLNPLTELAGDRICKVSGLSFFENIAHPSKRFSLNSQSSFSARYHPLSSFPKAALRQEKTDILIFSCDRPLQLYACLESIYHYMSGFEKISVLYRASNERFSLSYGQLKTAFPHVKFLAQSNNYKKDFKPLLMKALFNSPSKYILFSVDDLIVKDFIDLNYCMGWMDKTSAYGFYLRLGKHISYCYQAGKEQSVPISVPLAAKIYAWSFNRGEGDWGFPNSLDMTLYRKEDLKQQFKLMRFNTPNSLELDWAKKHRPQKAIGLYFEDSKVVNIPLNIVSRTGNPHMNYLSTDELLVKFEQGLKMDIRPLHQIENPSPHFEYLPDFISR